MKTIKILPLAAILALNCCDASDVMTTPPTSHGRAGLRPVSELTMSVSPQTAGRAGLMQSAGKSRANLEASRMTLTPHMRKTLSKFNSKNKPDNAAKRESTTNPTRHFPSSSVSSTISSTETMRSMTPPPPQEAYFPEDLTPEAKRRYDILKERDPIVKTQGYVTKSAIEEHTRLSISTEEINSASKEETLREIAYLSFYYRTHDQKTRRVIPVITPTNPFRKSRKNKSGENPAAGILKMEGSETQIPLGRESMARFQEYIEQYL